MAKKTKRKKENKKSKDKISKEVSAVYKTIEGKIEKFDKTEVHIALVGETGVGKSSFMNAMAGEGIAEVSSIEEKTGVINDKKVKGFKPVVHKSGNLHFYDLPGYGTDKYPTEDYIRELGIKDKYDCALLMTQTRFKQDDRKVYEGLIRKGIPVFVVRTKFDEAVSNLEHDFIGRKNKPTPQKLKEDVGLSIKKSLNHKDLKVYVISSRKPKEWDFPGLGLAIEKELPNEKKKRFIVERKAYSNVELNKKKKVAEELISYHAWIAAANGLNPIPGLDVAVDVGILKNLSSKVIKAYGLTEEKLDHLGDVISADFKIKVLQRLTRQFLTKEGIIMLLKKFAPRLAAKSFLKWIPFIGQGIAAGIGYKITSNFGKDLINQCHDISKEILDIETDN